MNPTVLIALDPAGWHRHAAALVARCHELSAEHLTDDAHREIEDWLHHATEIVDEAGERIAAGRGQSARTADLLAGALDCLERCALDLLAFTPSNGEAPR